MIGPWEVSLISIARTSMTGEARISSTSAVSHSPKFLNLRYMVRRGRTEHWICPACGSDVSALSTESATPANSDVANIPTSPSSHLRQIRPAPLGLPTCHDLRCPTQRGPCMSRRTITRKYDKHPETCGGSCFRNGVTDCPTTRSQTRTRQPCRLLRRAGWSDYPQP